MKRLAAALLALLLTTPALPGITVLVSRGSGTPPTCSTTSLTLWWRAEAEDFTATSGTDDFSAGDTTAVATSDASISASAGKNGTNGIATVSTDDYYTLSVSANDILSGTSGRAGFWFQYPNADPGGYPASAYIFDVRVSTTNRLRVAAAGTVSNRTLQAVWTDGTNPATTVTGANNAVSAATWYWIEVEWDASQGAGSDVLRLYLNGASHASNTAATMDPISPSALRLGSMNGTVGNPVYMDHILISSDRNKDLSLCKDTALYP